MQDLPSWSTGRAEISLPICRNVALGQPKAPGDLKCPNLMQSLLSLPKRLLNEQGRDMNSYLKTLRERWSDPLLTALTVLLVIMLFVVAPLQALGIFAFQAFELLFAIILVAGVFVMSGSRTAAIAMLISLVMASMGAIFRLKAPSMLDVNLFGAAWLVMGVTVNIPRQSRGL